MEGHEYLLYFELAIATLKCDFPLWSGWKSPLWNGNSVWTGDCYLEMANVTLNWWFSTLNWLWRALLWTGNRQFELVIATLKRWFSLNWRLLLRAGDFPLWRIGHVERYIEPAIATLNRRSPLWTDDHYFEMGRYTSAHDLTTYLPVLLRPYQSY